MRQIEREALMKRILFVAAMLLTAVLVTTPWASASPEPKLYVTAHACKNFSTDQVQWSLSWTGNVQVAGGWVQALDPDAQFGEAYFSLERRDQKRFGTTSGVLSNLQPWAASLADVYIVQLRVAGHTPNGKSWIEVVIDGVTTIPSC
jgi:hypothetical protein